MLIRGDAALGSIDWVEGGTTGLGVSQSEQLRITGQSEYGSIDWVAPYLSDPSSSKMMEGVRAVVYTSLDPHEIKPSRYDDKVAVQMRLQIGVISKKAVWVATSSGKLLSIESK